jgi:hypothetical protein
MTATYACYHAYINVVKNDGAKIADEPGPTYFWELGQAAEAIPAYRAVKNAS